MCLYSAPLSYRLLSWILGEVYNYSWNDRVYCLILTSLFLGIERSFCDSIRCIKIQRVDGNSLTSIQRIIHFTGNVFNKF